SRAAAGVMEAVGILILLVLLIPAGVFLFRLGRDLWEAFREEAENLERQYVRAEAEAELRAIRRRTVRQLLDAAGELHRRQFTNQLYRRPGSRLAPREPGGEVIVVDDDLEAD